MQFRMRIHALIAALAAASCGASEAHLSPNAQALWDRCNPSVARYCRDRSEGSYSMEHECLRDARTRLGALTDDGEQARLMTAHGCSTTPPSSGGATAGGPSAR